MLLRGVTRGARVGQHRVVRRGTTGTQGKAITGTGISLIDININGCTFEWPCLRSRIWDSCPVSKDAPSQRTVSACPRAGPHKDLPHAPDEQSLPLPSPPLALRASATNAIPLSPPSSPPGKPRALTQRTDLPVSLYKALVLLFLGPSLQLRQHHMLNRPRALILHDALLTLHQHLLQQLGYIRLRTEVRERREERLKVEDDEAGHGEAAQGLPIDAEGDVFGFPVEACPSVACTVCVSRAESGLIKVVATHNVGSCSDRSCSSACPNSVPGPANSASPFSSPQLPRCTALSVGIFAKYRSMLNCIFSLKSGTGAWTSASFLPIYAANISLLLSRPRAVLW